MSESDRVNFDLIDNLGEFLETINKTPEFPVQFGVTGSRGWDDQRAIIYSLTAVRMAAPDAIMHNGACPEGADALCLEWWGHLGGKNCYLHKPNFSVYGSPRAYHVRNQSIVARADFLLAFDRGETRGTASTIRFAEERGIPVFKFTQDV